MSKRKSKATKESDILKYIAWFLALLALSLLALAGGYYIGFENAKKELAAKEKKKEERRLELLQKIEETKRIFIKKLEIVKSTKQLNSIEVMIAIATLLPETELTE